MTIIIMNNKGKRQQRNGWKSEGAGGNAGKSIHIIKTW
jgi:hypothetical protein